MAKRVNTNVPPTMLMFDSRSGTNARDNGSTVTFNIPQGMDSVTETQTALIQLVDFQASNSFYNITNSNNTLEVFVQLYDTTGLALSKTSASSVVTIPNGYYNAYDLVNTLNTALNAITPTARPTGTSSTVGWYYNSFGIPAGYGSTNGINPITLNTNTGKITFQLPTISVLTDTAASTAAYSNADFNADLYAGFYLLSDTYPGLLLTLGFATTDFCALNTATTRYGVGVNLKPTVAYASLVSTVTYSVSNTVITNQLIYDNVAVYSVDSITGSLTPPNMCNLSYPRYLYLELEGVNTTNRTNLPNKSYRSFFAKIPVNAPFGSVITYEPYVSIPQPIPNLHLNCLTVHLYDEFGTPAQMNNGFWSIVISVEWAIDVGGAGMEDFTLGRTFRPILQNTAHDPLHTQAEHQYKRKR